MNVLNGTDTSTQVTVANRIRAQLAGATTTSGYVGGSSNNPPTSGTFVTGDFAIDAASACLWVCTSGGTPGTWQRVGNGGYAARRHQSSTSQTINNGFTTLNLDTADYDPRGMWNGTTHGFVIPFSGFAWRVTGRVSGNWSVANVRLATMIYVNGTEVSRGFDGLTANNFGGGTVSDILGLNSGDLVQLAVYCSSAGATETAQPGARVFLEIALVA